MWVDSFLHNCEQSRKIDNCRVYLNVAQTMKCNETEKVKWVLCYVSKNCWRTSVAVFFKATKLSRIGKSYITDKATHISFEGIFSICKFEVSTAYFSLNHILFFLPFRFPQGRGGSSSFSMVNNCMHVMWTAV